jgi:hypothetical protein
MWVKCCEEMENICVIETGYGSDLMWKFKTTGQEFEDKMLMTKIILRNVLRSVPSYFKFIPHLMVLFQTFVPLSEELFITGPYKFYIVFGQ